MHVAAAIAVAVVALIHAYILVLEMFLWTTPRGRRAFGTTEAFAQQSKVLAANQGLYNGFLAAGLAFGLFAGGAVGRVFQLFFLGCVIVAGLYGAATASRRILCIQALPAVVALLLLVLSGNASASPSMPPVSGVGFQSIEIRDPVGGGTMPGEVFYPSATPSAVTWQGPYELRATADAPPIAGAKPLVVISHGHSGSEFGHHDLAVYLAAHGFVVATLRHPKDDFHDASGDGQPEVMVGRPIQVKATIDMLLQDARWKTLIDPERIGVAGFSNGGYTSLLLVGAVPKFARFIDHCEAHPDDQGICSHAKDLVAELAKRGLTAQQYMAGMQGELGRWGDTADPRIKAAFAMAPQGLVFDEAGLAPIDRPVYLYYAQEDEVLRPEYNVLHIAPLIHTLDGVGMIPGAGHYVFLAPCSPQLAKEAADICRDPPGVDRADAHQRIDADALAFFEKTLLQKDIDR